MFSDRQELKTETTKLKPTLKSDSVNQIVLPNPTSDSPVGADPSLNSTTPMSHGTKKLISSIKNLLDRTSAVLVKFVHRIFPWNRRARRRVMGDGEDEEL